MVIGNEDAWRAYRHPRSDERRGLKALREGWPETSPGSAANPAVVALGSAHSATEAEDKSATSYGDRCPATSEPPQTPVASDLHGLGAGYCWATASSAPSSRRRSKRLRAGGVSGSKPNQPNLNPPNYWGWHPARTQYSAGTTDSKGNANERSSC